MTKLDKIISLPNAATQLGLSVEAFILLVEQGILTPYIVRMKQDGKYFCVDFFGSDGGNYPQRAFFHWDYCKERYQPVVFDCREIQAYMDAMPTATDIEESCVCMRPDPDYVPSWQSQPAPLPWEKERRRGTPQDCAAVAGWLEMERQGDRQEDKKIMCLECLTLGLEHLRGGTAEKAFHAAFGGDGPLTDAQKQKERQYRRWFIAYAGKMGHDFSWLDKLSPL